MRHYYIGVEHLLVALLEIRGGIARTLLEEHGLSPEYVINAIRLKMSKGSRTNQWPGTPHTPRASRVIDKAKQFAHLHEHDDIDERDLLLAVLHEHDSLIGMILEALGLNLKQLIEMAETLSNSTEEVRLYARIDYAKDFPESLKPNQDEINVLRRMFPGYARIRVERRLTGGYTRALLLVVTPIHVGDIQDAPVVVKIDHIDTILDEAQRYETHVKNTLPPLTARLVDRPTAPDNLPYAGLKYTLITAPDMPPRDLRSMSSEWDSQAIGRWLHENLYPSFGKYWWNQSRQYRFTAWREYDWLLPPILTVEKIPDNEVPSNAFSLRFPVKRARLTTVEVGAVVVIENFTVRKVDPERNTLQLAIGLNPASEMAYKVEMRGLDLGEDTYYRGEVVERIAGRVMKTRREQLTVAARALQPDFDLELEYIPVSVDRNKKIPNPLFHYENELERLVNGTISRIHGDLHLGNIMIGPQNSAFLIDFAKAREGHTLFDWASLEISILSDIVMAAAGEDWEAARKIAEYLTLLNGGKPLPDGDSTLVKALTAVVEIRQIVRECLAINDAWLEYFVALAFCGLRAITWDYMGIPARRLMFLVSGMAFHELRFRVETNTADDITRSPDETDLHNTL